MNANPTSQQWNPISNPEDDFAPFLDFGDLNFSAFTDDVAVLPAADTGVGLNDEGTTDHPMGEAVEPLEIENHDEMASVGRQTLHDDFSMNTYPTPYNSDGAGYTPRGQDPRRLQQQWPGPNMVPPTPNSMDLQAGHIHGYAGGFNHQQQQQQLYEHYCRVQEDQVNFTPLISPAVTPLETQLHYPDSFSEAFSPLTSPALRAQSHASHSSIYGSVRGSDTSTTTSPLDMSREYSGPTSVSNPSNVRRSRRKASSGSTKTPARSVRQSPAMKPQHRKKQTSSTIIPAKEVASVIEGLSSEAGSGGALVTSGDKQAASDQSAADSVSPESLSEILMPPPATPQPGSAGRSPYLYAKQNDPTADTNMGEGPATPASLMRIRKQAEKSSLRKREASHLKDQNSHPGNGMEQIMEDISLPEPAPTRAKKSGLSSIDTAQANAPKTAGEKPRPNGQASAPATTTVPNFPSASGSAVTSPKSPKPKKGAPELKSKAREVKKRSNTISEKASPALVPRISPSIKPLLPEGTSVSPETSALLLASKSNYQNILEGTHFPGVSYPENLSTNLTSKRTSHKIAEQGRRNRINTALQEIALLLPPTSPPVFAVNDSSKPRVSETGQDRANAMMSATTAQQQSNSKASTVEAAIDYIKSLQQEVRECRGKLAEYEKKDEVKVNVSTKTAGEA